MSPQPLKVAMIGGGGGAFIANPHQKAIFFDGTRKVHSVALHPDPEIAKNEADNWPYPVKGYTSYDELFADQANLPAILVDGPVLADLELFTFVGPTGATRGLDHIDPPESALQSDGATRPDRVLPEPVVDEGATRPDRALHVRQVLRLRRVRHVLRQYVQAPEGARLRAALEYLGLQGVDLYDLQVAACEYDRVLRRSRIFVRPRPRARWLARRRS